MVATGKVLTKPETGWCTWNVKELQGRKKANKKTEGVSGNIIQSAPAFHGQQEPAGLLLKKKKTRKHTNGIKINVKDADPAKGKDRRCLRIKKKAHSNNKGVATYTKQPAERPGQKQTAGKKTRGERDGKPLNQDPGEMFPHSSSGGTQKTRG